MVKPFNKIDKIKKHYLFTRKIIGTCTIWDELEEGHMMMECSK